jgi:hypothetical protein
MSRSRTFFDRNGALAEYVDGELVWARPGAFDEPDEGPQVIRDIAPYRSMIDGSVIDGRKRHRDHLKAHGCIEIGNDTSHINKARVPSKPAGPSRKESLHRMLADVGDRDMQRIIQNTIKDRR